MVNKILVVFGTRPEAIKMCPLVNNLKQNFDVSVCVTAQHREMLDQVLEIFEVKPDFDLDSMKNDQDLFDITSRVLLRLGNIIEEVNPDLLLVHGDTTTTLASAMAAYYKKVPIGHVEAGLRTYNIHSPYPEEFNRQVVSKIASLNFAPTIKAKNNLLKEKIALKKIVVTGNTVIDALLEISKKSEKIIFSDDINKSLPFLSNPEKKIILVTGHRRENFGEGLKQICLALKEISKREDVDIIYPVHLNPNVKVVVNKYLKSSKNIHLIEPLSYIYFVKLMKLSTIILTDSGGIQEEAPSLGKPVLVMRDNTERPEAIEAGTAKLVGAKSKKIVAEVRRLLDNQDEYINMSLAKNPYGSGQASQKISNSISKYFS
tara:strand:+ start:22776 stop:23897 length:1122 start_codon:yes stop_codon:yes gene_type:complete